MSGPTQVAVRGLSFRYDAQDAPVLEGLDASFPRGFTGVVGANGRGKSTLLELLAGALQPDAGEVLAPAHRVHCPQRTDRPPFGLDVLLAGEDAESWVIRGRLDVPYDADARWRTLSHGERKRAQIAVALHQAPDLLTIDEPTNHIDADTREMLEGALGTFHGVGVIVSHDRDLLDTLCVQCLWFEGQRSRLLSGGYSAGRAVLNAEAAAQAHAHAGARAELDRVERETKRRRAEAAASRRRASKDGIDRRDHDAKERVDRARVTGKDTAAGRRLRALDGRLAQAAQRASVLRPEKQHAVGVHMPGARSRRDAVLMLEAGTVALGPCRVLRHPALFLRPDARVAITGANGIGKSTLLRVPASQWRVPEAQRLELPQEVDEDTGRACLDAVRELPGDVRGELMQLVSRLGSRPAGLLSSACPSPGEVRKLMLARGLLPVPQLIVLDEPTNHLDLPSVEALEAALAQCSAALVLVSHDRRFLDALTEQKWVLKDVGCDTELIVE